MTSAADNALIVATIVTPIENARVKYKALQAAGASELAAALDYGDAAILLKKTAPKRGWQVYVKDNVGASKTVVNECIRLAKARLIIEADLDGMPSKSIRGALRFLRDREKGNRPPKPVESKSAPDLMSMTSAERKALFATADFETIAADIPKEWFRKLQDRFVRQLNSLPKAARNRKIAALPAVQQDDGTYAVPVEEAA